MLGTLCNTIDCNLIQVHIGTDDKVTNAERSIALASCFGCDAITYGYDIYIRNLEPDGTINPTLLAHEGTHVSQYKQWGAAYYYADAVMTQSFNALGDDQYQVPKPMTKPFGKYGMEQQATIVEQCFGGDAESCAKSPYQFPIRR
jgi:hypothetical protein